MKRVLVLGAGFSRAVSSSMPMTDGLAEKVLAKLTSGGHAVPRRTFSGNQFEAWLSRLAEPQPDLDEPANLENRALFLRVSAALREVLLESQNEAFASANPPWWLRRLLGVLHFTDSTAITFNYDLLIEATLDQCAIWDAHNHLVGSTDVLRNMPRLAKQRSGGGFVTTVAPAVSFRYIKLHGSVDTFWTTGDRTGETLARWQLSARWGTPVTDSPQARQHVLPGRVPFIVPPTAIKSPFYDNPFSRQLWQDAAAAIREATHVGIVGYSIPMTDTVTSGMLADCLDGRSSRVEVVNLATGPVVRRLEDLGVDSPRLDAFEGNDACSDYVSHLERDLAPAVQPGAPHDDLPLSVGLDQRRPTWRVTRIVGVGPDGTAQVEAHAPWSTTATASVAITLRDLHTVGTTSRVEVQFLDSARAFVARADALTNTSGDPYTLLLRPTAIPT